MEMNEEDEKPLEPPKPKPVKRQWRKLVDPQILDRVIAQRERHQKRLYRKLVKDCKAIFALRSHIFRMIFILKK